MTGYIGMLKDLSITQDQMDYVTNHLTTIEFEKEYGTFDINIQDGMINYPENGEADKKD